MTDTNPLLDFSALPRFADVRPEHLEPAISALLTQAQTAVDAVALSTDAASWDTVVAPLTEPLEQLSRAWSMASHLQAVVDTPALRAAYNDQLPAITEFHTKLGQDLRLFARYQALADSAGFADLAPARKRIVELALRDFRLGGAALEGAARDRYAVVAARLAELSQKFSENVLDATTAFAHVVQDEAQLKGLPADVLAAASAAAKDDGLPGYKFTLHLPSYMPVMQYAEHRALRETLHRAYVTRASDLADPAQDNSTLIVEMLALKKEMAGLLGFGNYAELSLATKMAGTPAEVTDFVRDMASRAKPFAERDMQALRDFAAAALGLPELQAWDLAFVTEKLREARYSYSDQEVKQYFTAPRAMLGLFDVVQTLFAVQIEPATAQTWHPDVQFYTLRRNGVELAHLYVDNQARDGKRGGAWMDVCRSRRLTERGLQTPIAHVTCNFAPPVGDAPALLTHSNITTLFHEFGHALHHVLTQVDEPGADMRAVEWDAIELPSQFMENFAWEWQVVQGMSAHVDTGASLPRELFDKMLAARNFQSGMGAVRQMEFALFDMLLHGDDLPADAAAVQRVLDAVRAEVAVVPVANWNRFQHSFGHIFGGGYAAGYYSYKWAEVMSADAFGLFEETGALNPDAGARFMHEVLEVGGSRPARDSFAAFRGRDPQIEALLRQRGMLETA